MDYSLPQRPVPAAPGDFSPQRPSRWLYVMKGKRDKLRAQGVRVRLRCETGVWRFNIPIKIGINSGVEGDAPQGKFYAETRRSLRTTGARCERVESRIPMRWSSSIEDFAIHGFPIGDSCHKGLSRPRREISPSMAPRRWLFP